MFKNYLKIAWRNIVRHKVFAFVNISGLAIGIAACLLLFTVINYELSFDKFQPDYDRIVHIFTKHEGAIQASDNPGSAVPALSALRTDMPGAVIGGLYANYGSQVTVVGEDSAGTPKKFIEESGNFFADPEFFSVFKYKWVSGNPAVLGQPGMTVLTKSRADKYFGQWEQATGRLLILDNSVTVKVGGIIEDVPGNSDFPLQLITSFETYRTNPATAEDATEWGHTSSNFQIFMLPAQGTSLASLNAQLRSLGKKYYPVGKRNYIKFNAARPLSEVHFDKKLSNFGTHVTSKGTLMTLGLIGAFIIIMACINFINLSTARAAGRSKEIGIRKVLGSSRTKLFLQVMSETGLLVLAGSIIAIGLAAFFLPFIKHISFIEESLNILSGKTAWFLVAILLVVTFLAGSYPALVLSRFRPVMALKNKINAATIGGISLRRGLVVVQFAISQILIVGTVVAISQMNFVRKADLGFNKEGVFIIRANADSALLSRQSNLYAKLRNLPAVEYVSFSSDVPSSDNNWSTNFSFDHKPDEDFNLFTKYADKEYFKTYGLRLLAGKAFSESDTLKEVVINETLMKKLGIQEPGQIIGKDLGMGGSHRITGVVADFKTNSLREEVKPLAIGQFKQYYSVAGIRLRGNESGQAIAAVQKEWDAVYPEYAYTSAFMSDNISQFYEEEDRLSLLYKIFAGIAIFISCLGLYGLISFMAVQRTKEIGVRKVLGASVKNIIFLFSKEFTVLILLGLLIAVPVAWYMMSDWLSNFVFRIPITPLIFIVAAGISLVIAWITAGYKSLKAAMASPVTSLRAD